MKRARAVMRELNEGGGGAAAALRTDEVPRHAVRLVVVGAVPCITSFATLPQLLRAGDLVVVNDAATLPASLAGHTSAGAAVELRLTGPIETNHLNGVLFGAGDYRTRTEHRPPPPQMVVGDRVQFGTFDAEVTAVSGRVVELATHLTGDALWQALYAAGAPVQYAHRPERLALWSVQTAYAGRPWAVEMPSAGRPLTWDALFGLRRAGIALATLTHAAGLSSIGDEALDHALPFPERYEIPRRTVEAITATRDGGGRVIAVGTTVVRALEAAAQTGELAPGAGVATLRLEPRYRPRVVDGIISGLHAPGETHFELLQAFAPRIELEAALARAMANGLSSHELGDACLVLRDRGTLAG
ncbi:MAG: S-adenosylmethionine:tRNA ribosyltransferase-isomerase [Kofleriaceae bacterium]|nr:S-adenosylmethionine:tRNA ribosyltransferase-isomerase [Kofleriaceae bacterium]